VIGEGRLRELDAADKCEGTGDGEAGGGDPLFGQIGAEMPSSVTSPDKFATMSDNGVNRGQPCATNYKSMTIGSWGGGRGELPERTVLTPNWANRAGF